MSFVPNYVGNSIPNNIGDQRSTGPNGPGRRLVRGVACISVGLAACSSMAATEANVPIETKAINSNLIDVEQVSGRLIAVGECGQVLY